MRPTNVVYMQVGLRAFFTNTSTHNHKNHHNMNFLLLASKCFNLQLHAIAANQRFISLFGLDDVTCQQFWNTLIQGGFCLSCQPKRLLWTLYFLKCYPTERNASVMLNIDEKTFRKWVWYVIEEISTLDNVSPFQCV